MKIFTVRGLWKYVSSLLLVGALTMTLLACGDYQEPRSVIQETRGAAPSQKNAVIDSTANVKKPKIESYRTDFPVAI